MVGGLLGGAAFGIVLTRLGKLITDAPPATASNYLWNALLFGLVASVVSPLVSWNFLRRAPIWRTVAEPLGFALAGGTAALLLGVPTLLLALPPAGLILGFLHLHRRHREPATRIAARRDDEE